ncbi:tryptophan-rich sensory protein [Erythrobacter insulae]|uniref:Tryptophan-rich sensory protein n=1 Tax=Erythrobacter insulae TaxID=2584124 RepID=A0A547PCY7_9SPHN|nr:TspO/MBR family protein [Erythrobacter insulae]TRD11998.1 tryptophan-rich sensory protein [Erythrobacter insulae]
MRATLIIPVTVATIAALVVAALGATITDLGPWYQSLQKPDWNPPDAVFPMVWTLIYALIWVSGISAWRAAPNSESGQWVISLFALNGFLNITWSLIFFRLQRPDWAMVELVLLWLSIVLLIIYCGRHSRLSSVLLVPYLIWVTIAGALNWAILQLNGPFG